MSRITPQNDRVVFISNPQALRDVDVVQFTDRIIQAATGRIADLDSADKLQAECPRSRRDGVARVIHEAAVQTLLDAVDSTQNESPRDIFVAMKRIQAYERALFNPSTAEVEGFARWLDGLQCSKEKSRQDKLPPLPLRVAVGTEDPDDIFEEATSVVPEYQLRQAEPPPLPLEYLRHLLQTRLPVLYYRVLEPTLADIREEHVVALAEGNSLKARCVLLRGCGALAKAAVSQLGFSFLGGIAALWRARRSRRTLQER